MRASLTRTIIKLVVFFALCSVFTAYLAFTIGNIRLFRHTYTLKASFDDATGLLADDNVKVAGVVVGKVTSVKIDQGRAKVQFICALAENWSRERATPALRSRSRIDAPPWAPSCDRSCPESY